MRLNKFIAHASGLSRRKADDLIGQGKIRVNEHVAHIGAQVDPDDVVTLDGEIITSPENDITILLHKPKGYVCSRRGQGSKTIYELLPEEYTHLKPVGRLDKDSSGLLLLTSDGQMHHELTHPSFTKEKLYEVTLDKELTESDRTKIQEGVALEDGVSSLQLSGKGKQWHVSMHQGRNRQIRRTFASLGYSVKKLHRTQFGPHKLGTITSGKFEKINI
ncbi:MAG: pseudouridine synthase [Candidatus Saccharibacteria bacterium]|nr:pseudouridine synthase [Candidatus Saccharibacteria bacterium]